MTALPGNQTQVSREPNPTIKERCSDPAFQQFLSQTHRRWWKDGESKGLSPQETAEAIIHNACAHEPSETHPEYRSLVAVFERGRVQVAEQCQTLNQGENHG